MTLTEIRAILNDRKILLTKSLGQNFLHDTNVVDKIARLGEVKPGDQVLEIGPGLGPLTDGLLRAGATVLAIEKDQRLVSFLEEKYLSNPQQVTVLAADGLEWLKLGAWGVENSPPHWKCISNLPYSVASPMLVEMGFLPHPPAIVVATIQLEVAKRIQAIPGNKVYGTLTALLNWSFELGANFKIPASCFFPEPDVDSACVALKLRDAPLTDRETLPVYRHLVRSSFEKRRKQMQKILKDWILPSEWDDLQTSVSVAPADRPETIPPEQFALLAKWLKANTDFGKNPV